MAEREVVGNAGITGHVVQAGMVYGGVTVHVTPPDLSNLPPAPAPFAGREAELADMFVRSREDVPIVLCGEPGIGKTSLALHWAHLGPVRFPGGRFYFRGPRPPLRRLLARLGADHAAIPEGLFAQREMLRGLVADRPILVVLDDIADPGTASRLLGGIHGCTVVITSQAGCAGALVLLDRPDSPRPAGAAAIGSWSGRDLQRLLPLGLAPAVDFPLPAIGALLGSDPAETEDQVVRLTEAGVLAEWQSRYRVPELARPVLSGLMADPEPGLRRLIEYYLDQAEAADRQLAPGRGPLLAPTANSVTNPQDALAWLDTEHDNLLAVQQLCLRLALHDQARELAMALSTYHRRRGLLDQPWSTWRSARTAAEHMGDNAGLELVRRVFAEPFRPGTDSPEVLALEGMAAVHAELGDYEGARINWERARELRLTKRLEVTVYTTGDNGEPVRDAVLDLLEVIGFELAGMEPPVRGSWFQRFRMRGDARAMEKLGELAGKLERAAELKYIGAPRSENDEREANAIAKLAEAMKDVDEVVVRTSSVLFVKSGGCVMSIVLSEAQIRCLDENPQLMRAPGQVLDALAELVRGAPVPLAVEGQTG